MNSKIPSFVHCLLLGSVLAILLAGAFVLGGPEYEKVKPGADYFYGGDSTCGVREGDKYVPAIQHDYGGYDWPKDIKCMADFKQWSEKMLNRSRLACSDPRYLLRKHCVMTKFFENKPAEESRALSGDWQVPSLSCSINGTDYFNTNFMYSSRPSLFSLGFTSLQ